MKKKGLSKLTDSPFLVWVIIKYVTFFADGSIYLHIKHHKWVLVRKCIKISANYGGILTFLKLPNSFFSIYFSCLIYT